MASSNIFVSNSNNEPRNDNTNVRFVNSPCIYFSDTEDENSPDIPELNVLGNMRRLSEAVLRQSPDIMINDLFRDHTYNEITTDYVDDEITRDYVNDEILGNITEDIMEEVITDIIEEVIEEAIEEAIEEVPSETVPNQIVMEDQMRDSESLTDQTNQTNSVSIKTKAPSKARKSIPPVRRSNRLLQRRSNTNKLFKQKREQMHVVCQNCPGWKKFGWVCEHCGSHNKQLVRKHIISVMTCFKCRTFRQEWKCGCLYDKLSDFSKHIIGKRVSVYWPKYKCWYNGTVVKKSNPSDGGTHDVRYDNDPENYEPISEKLVGDQRENWYLV
jgi:hypothetical protein